MECKKSHDLIEKYVSNNINDSETAQLKAHIKNCPECADLFEDAQFSSQVFSNIPDLKAPLKLSRSIITSLKNQDAFKSVNFFTRFTGMPYFKTAVSIAALFILACFLFLPENSTIPPNGTELVQNSGSGVNTNTQLPADTNKTFQNSTTLNNYECRVLLAGPETYYKTTASDWQAAQTGTLLQQGFALKTGISQLIIQYKDMTEVRIKPGSHVVIQNNSLKIQKGSTWLKVTKKESHFEISTPTCVAGVLGTRLGVCVTDANTSCVSVFEGKVMVTAAEEYNKKSSEPVYLLANQKVFSNSQHGLSKKSALVPSEENLWKSADLKLDRDVTMPSYKYKHLELRIC
jgi:RNase P/RNase MRP subunit p29